jgi:hypothetical protein
MEDINQTNEPTKPTIVEPAKEEPTGFDAMVTPGAELDVIEGGSHGVIQLANFSNVLDMSSEDMTIPRLRLAQGLTGEVQDGTAKPGEWLMTGFESVPELTIVPLLFARNRALRDDEGMVLCKSEDATAGIGEPGGDCSKCPMNQWSDGAKGERIPPKCVFSYVYITYVSEFETMALVEFRRTSIQAGKTLNTMAAQRGLGNFMVKLRSSKQSGKRGTFYQIVVQPTQADADLLARARAAVGM